MSSENVRKYYIQALHALRSASEQGAVTAPLLESKARNADLKAIVADYRETAIRHEEHIVSFMGVIGVEPNDFKDRVMEGVSNGTSEMLKAASHDVIDLGVLSAAQTGAQYFRFAFVGQPTMAEAFGLDEQATRWVKMADEWQTILDQLSEIGVSVMAAAMVNEREHV